MKVIDILNKIANGEKVPNKIKVLGYTFIYTGEKSPQKFYKLENQNNYLLRDFVYTLDTEVEIIEEKKIPENINKNYKIRIFNSGKPHKINYDMEKLIEMVQDIFSKQMEIIDYLQSKGDSSNE